ncbi:methyltransferase [Amycolatopsis sp. 195334CR]|uniref:methyltransferase n=1 Tax=Amycolatopsis sp. 195334CR TaxID=2814588 RepID=UPI001A8E639E|nr:methyltransferase [Amycolatopsis sp. 195334CR]MBN6038842.1 methyltransferase [Amycolatopsis sp. 195334CR]
MTEAQPRELMRLVFGGMAAQVIGVLTRLELADAIGDGGATIAELAAAKDIPGQQMYRLLRAAAGLGLLAEHDGGRFELTPQGALLRRDSPASLHAFARMFTDPIMLAAWPNLEHSLRTGSTSFEDVFGASFFDHLAKVPEMSALFNASMSQATGAVAATLPAAYDFGRFHTLADIGGGDGTLLSAVLTANPDLRGLLFDSEAGAAQAPETLGELTQRCEVHTGNFFESVPAGADAYLLKSILHDWSDEQCAAILGHCRAVLPENGRVLIVEPVLPELVPPGGPGGIYLSDLNMLVNVGGRERTRTDFENLCESAGLRLTEVIPLPPQTGFSVLEAVKPADRA